MNLLRSTSLVGALLAAACQANFDPALLDAHGGAGGSAPSTGGASTGGATGTSGAATTRGCEGDPPCAGISCCNVAQVPGGSFSRGYDASGSATQPGASESVSGFQSLGAAKATVGAFGLDTFEVTVNRFRRFMTAYDGWRAAGNPKSDTGAHPLIPGSGWKSEWESELPRSAEVLTQSLDCGPESTLLDATSAQTNLPINCVSWYVAFAFCAWDGGRLPTEAEWNYAAAGDEQRAFPWSAPPDSLTLTGEHAVYGDVAVAAAGSRATLDGGRFGHHDLAGNVREWTLDTCDEVASYTEPDGCNDCASLSGTRRARRGGDFGADAARSRTAYRSSADPSALQVYNGLRCAR